MSLPLTRFTAGAALLAASVGPAVAQQVCADVARLKLPYTTITSAATAAEGPIPQPAIFGNSAPIVAPERCEVQAVTRPSKDSEIRIEIWLPVTGWNGKYLQIGNPNPRQRRARANRAGRPPSARICRSRNRRRSRERRPGTGCLLGYRASGKTDRFRLSGGARNKYSGQSYPPRLFWTQSGPKLLQRVF